MAPRRCHTTSPSQARPSMRVGWWVTADTVAAIPLEKTRTDAISVSPMATPPPRHPCPRGTRGVSVDGSSLHLISARQRSLRFGCDCGRLRPCTFIFRPVRDGFLAVRTVWVGLVLAMSVAFLFYVHCSGRVHQVRHGKRDTGVSLSVAVMTSVVRCAASANYGGVESYSKHRSSGRRVEGELGGSIRRRWRDLLTSGVGPFLSIRRLKNVERMPTSTERDPTRVKKSTCMTESGGRYL